MICNSVDFPEPDGPIIATNSPFSTEKETSERAFTFVSPVPYTDIVLKDGQLTFFVIRDFQLIIPRKNLCQILIQFIDSPVSFLCVPGKKRKNKNTLK